MIHIHSYSHFVEIITLAIMYEHVNTPYEQCELINFISLIIQKILSG